MLGLQAGHEVHDFYEALHCSHRSLAGTLRDGKTEVRPPGDDTDPQGMVTISTWTSPGGMFAIGSADAGPLVRAWGDRKSVV